MYKIGISNKAIKELDKLHDEIYCKISDKINSLSNEPHPVGSIKLTDIEGYGIRAGDYRILYTINENQKIVILYSVAHRKNAYRKGYTISEQQPELRNSSSIN